MLKPVSFLLLMLFAGHRFERTFFIGEYHYPTRIFDAGIDTITGSLILTQDSFKIYYLLPVKERKDCRFTCFSGTWTINKNQEEEFTYVDGTVVKGRFVLPPNTDFPQFTYLYLENNQQFVRTIF